MKNIKYLALLSFIGISIGIISVILERAMLKWLIFAVVILTIFFFFVRIFIRVGCRSKLLLTIMALLPLLAATEGELYTYVRLTLYITILSFFIFTFITKTRTKIYIPGKFIILMLILLLLWSIVRLNNYLSSINYEFPILILGLIVYIIALIIEPISESELCNIINFGTIISIVVAASGFLINYSFGEAMTGIFDNPNPFAGYLLAMCFFPLSIALNRDRSIRERKSGILVILFLSTCIILTFSRSTWLGIIIMLIVLWIVSGKSSFVEYSRLALFLLLILSLLPIINLYLGNETIRKLSLDVLGKKPETGRLNMWISIFEYIKQNALLGYGTGVPVSLLIGRQLSSHNLYIQFIFQLGLIGLSIVISLFASVIYYLKKAFENNCATAALAIFSGLAVRDFFEVSLLQNNIMISITTWTFVGLALSRQNYNHVSKK